MRPGAILQLCIGVGFAAGAADLLLSKALDDGVPPFIAPNQSSFAAGITGMLSPVAGVVGGGIAEIFRNSKTFVINGDTTKSKLARQAMLHIE